VRHVKVFISMVLSEKCSSGLIQEILCSRSVASLEKTTTRPPFFASVLDTQMGSPTLALYQEIFICGKKMPW
jgi:hypothetical protein